VNVVDVSTPKPADKSHGPLFVENKTIDARAITSVEGGAVVGVLTVKQLIAGDEMTLLEFHAQPGVVSPSHIHAHESLLYVVKGRLKSVVAGVSHILSAGDVCRHPAGAPHHTEALESTTFVEIKSPAPDMTRVLGT
jgi:quercetin dioxygenase-like cupin family protein